MGCVFVSAGGLLIEPPLQCRHCGRVTRGQFTNNFSHCISRCLAAAAAAGVIINCAVVLLSAVPLTPPLNSVIMLRETNTNLRFTIGGGDNCAILDFSQRHLTGHSWTYLRNFWFCRIFFRAKLPPRTAKTVFANPKGPPFGCWKKNFFKSSFYQSHVVAFVLTIPKWYNTWVLQIFFVNIWSKIFFKIFFFNFLKKYFQKIFSIPKCYTILESWEQMP